jgi:hypothetical protein
MCGRMRNYPSDKELAAQLLLTLDAKLDAYDTILSQQKYLAGDVRADLFSSLHIIT